MTLTYEQCKSLKDVGFPQNGNGHWVHAIGNHHEYEYESVEEYPDYYAYVPTLSELIEACGDDFGGISRGKHPTEVGQWAAYSINASEFEDMVGGQTAIEAVCNLFIALKGT